MSTPMKRNPLTSDQKRQLHEDIAYVEERLRDISVLMRVCHGDNSQAAIRADETAAALQRLKWELERTQQKRQAAG